MDVCLILLHHKGTGIMSYYNMTCEKQSHSIQCINGNDEIWTKIRVFKNPVTTVESTKVLSLKELHCHVQQKSWPPAR